MSPDESLLVDIMGQTMTQRARYPNDRSTVTVSQGFVTRLASSNGIVLCHADAELLARYGWLRLSDGNRTAELTYEGMEEALRLHPIPPPNLLRVLGETARSHLFSDGPNHPAGMGVARIFPGKDPNGLLAVVVSEEADSCEEWFGKSVMAVLLRDYGWASRCPTSTSPMEYASRNNKLGALSNSVADARRVSKHLRDRRPHSDALLISVPCREMMEEHALGLADEIMDLVAAGDWSPLHAGVVVTTRSREVARRLAAADPHVVVVSGTSTSLPQWASRPLTAVTLAEAEKTLADARARIASADAELKRSGDPPSGQ